MNSAPILCLFLTYIIGIQCQLPEVVIPQGVLRGHYGTTVNGHTFKAYEGIPYARPPVGKYRFKDPQPPKPWVGTWNANTLYKCMQYNHYTEPGQDFVIGDEDCLYLNVYTPDTNSTSLLDVVIFIHGGAFMFNYGGSYGPKILLERNTNVFVTMNYRLGPLGFLSTEDSVLPGNNGLKDQLMALKWVKQNIKSFGGNPDSVTLTGMSAGGASSHIHLLSPLSQGLFHRGISQSGTALTPWVLVEKSLEKAQKVAATLGCPTSNSKELVDCLRHKPARQIVDTVKHFLPWLYNPFSPFGVVVDKYSEQPILPEHPYLTLKSGNFPSLPWIFSNVDSEGLYPGSDFVADPSYLKQIDDQWNDLVPHIMDYNNTVSASQRDAVSGKIREFYFKSAPVTKATYPILIKAIGDRLFIADIERTAHLHAAASNSPTYYYYFTYRGAHSKSELRSKCNEDFGAAHADDTVYVLSSNVNVHTTESDAEMSRIVTDIWINYASTSDPSTANIVWTPVSRDPNAPLDYLHLASPGNISMQSLKSLGNRQFWDSLPIQENKRLFFTKDEL